MKKALVLFVVVFLGLLLSPIIYLYQSIPRHQINRLEKGFVQVQKEQAQAIYFIVDKKPAHWVTLEEMPPYLSQAIVVSEDWSFFKHEGYDLGQIREALRDYYGRGEKLRGASTISQQVVKNLFLSHERTVQRKLIELIYTIYLEKKVSKRKILEIYLNIAQFGDELYGVKAASQKYFNKSVDQLSAKEAAFLAMLLPSPVRYSQSFKQRKLTQYADKTISDILEKLNKAGYINQEELKKAKGGRLGFERVLEPSLPDKAEDLKKLDLMSDEKYRKSKKSVRRAKTLEESRRMDNDVVLDEDPDYDPNAILEDNSGIEEEFNLE